MAKPFLSVAWLVGDVVDASDVVLCDEAVGGDQFGRRARGRGIVKRVFRIQGKTDLNGDGFPGEVFQCEETAEIHAVGAGGAAIEKVGATSGGDCDVLAHHLHLLLGGEFKRLAIAGEDAGIGEAVGGGCVAKKGAAEEAESSDHGAEACRKGLAMARTLVGEDATRGGDV